ESTRDAADLGASASVPATPDAHSGDENPSDPSNAPSAGCGIHPPAIGGVTDRIVEDLLSRPDNPVDQALADLLSHTKSTITTAFEHSGSENIDAQGALDDRLAPSSQTDSHESRMRNPQDSGSTEADPSAPGFPPQNHEAHGHESNEAQTADKEHP